MTPGSARPAWTVALITVAVLTIASYAHELLSRVPAYRHLHRTAPFQSAPALLPIPGATTASFASPRLPPGLSASTKSHNAVESSQGLAYRH